jgi:molecular chaperone GrpE
MVSEERDLAAPELASTAAATESAMAKQLGTEPEVSPEARESGQTAADRITELEAQIAGMKEDVLRARAEADNIRKRAQRDVEAAHRYALERFVGELLPVKDSMDWGSHAATEATDLESLRKGFALTSKLLADALQKAGVIELDPVGEKFNPQYHQAMGMEDKADAAPGTILRVMQKGYLLNDRLVRPAMVIVARQVTDVQA